MYEYCTLMLGQGFGRPNGNGRTPLQRNMATAAFNHLANLYTQNNTETLEIYWLVGKHSPLSLQNKLLIYKTVLKPVWTYGMELSGCATKPNIAVIQRYQSRLLRTITIAPWYVSN